VSVKKSINKQKNYMMIAIFPQSVNTNDVQFVSLPSNQTNSFMYTMNCQERDDSYYYINVTNLKYPFAHYDFRIYVRSSLARGEDKWSPPGYINLKTKPSSELFN